MSEEDNDVTIIHVKQEDEVQRKRPKKVQIPHRTLSVTVEKPKIIVMTAGQKPKPVRLNRCLVSPPTLYELAAAVVDKLDYPDPFEWSKFEVAQWIDEDVGFPQYKECILDNHINGRRLLRFEDPSQLPKINIHDFEHIKIITAAIRKAFATDYVRFKRSINLPIRKPATHCTWFKSLTGPSWGFRQNYTRIGWQKSSKSHLLMVSKSAPHMDMYNTSCVKVYKSDVLRWMKILNPKPMNLDHWDLVWYQKPDCPKYMYARIPAREKDETQVNPTFEPPEEYCNEYQAPRKFRILKNIPDEAQLIWMEHRPGSPSRKEPKKKKEGGIQKTKDGKKSVPKRDSRLMPKRIVLEGLSGKELILARRKKPKAKFLA